MRKGWIDRARPGKARSVLALLFAIAAFFALSASPVYAAADRRVALVIGNAAYKIAPRLDNPVIDAKAVAAKLKSLGFQVFEGYDLNSDQMRSALSQFSAALEGSDAALVYYSGHGVALDGENYLLPTDINPKTPGDLDLNAISATQVLKQMRRDERAIVLILDACREDPFAAELARTKSRAIIGARGLNPIEGDAARGALIAFATDPNSVAFDGPPGQHSPFTKALLDHLDDAGVPIETVMSRVRAEVWAATKNKQLPWVNTSIIGEFALNPKPEPAAAASPAPAPASQSTENLLWESAQRSNLAADYKAYLDAFPSGVFAQMARNRIAALSAPDADQSASLSRTATVEADAAEAEKKLNLAPAERRELQLRLAALKFDAGPPDGDFGDKARAAIREWQKRHDLKPTGYFEAPQQVTMLREESEDAYRRLIAPPIRIQKAPVANAHPEPLREEPRRRQRPSRPAHRPVAEPSRQAAQPAPPPATDQFIGGCQAGFHNVPAPTPSGYRCVQNGY
ncbi:MAG TPA: caspase family protein [Roseiarcus sp.]|nr:caspase family protein [Roseiarcus sp.]